MGAATFNQYVDDPDPDAAFRAAREAARHDNGSAGYTGTIAENDDYDIITGAPLSLKEAAKRAAELIDRADPRIADKWGPAGAIAVRRPTRRVTVDRLDGTTTNPSELDEQALGHITGVARQRGLIGPGETAKTGWLLHYQPANRPHTSMAGNWSTAHGENVIYTKGTAELTVRKDPAKLAAQTEPDGWLFFGLASE
jgi:hypothetical protein